MENSRIAMVQATEWRTQQELLNAKRKEKIFAFYKKLAMTTVFLAAIYVVWQQAENYIQQRKWANPGIISTDCTSCPEMISIPSGKFMMGIDPGPIGFTGFSSPVHEVTLQKFLIGRMEVTQGQWTEIMGSNPSINIADKNHPVENVSWMEVQQFLSKLSAKTGKNYRLPSEAEWEYAARAGGTSDWTFGSDERKLGNFAWYYNNSGLKTHQVGTKSSNTAGIFDVHGNVAEWVQDSWHNNYIDAPTNGTAREGGNYSDNKVIRGGSYVGNPADLKIGGRTHRSRHEGSGQVGFRVARSE
jgi:formylglycine-generating enzyme required for sulfatase activity